MALESSAQQFCFIIHMSFAFLLRNLFCCYIFLERTHACMSLYERQSGHRLVCVQVNKIKEWQSVMSNFLFFIDYWNCPRILWKLTGAR